MHGCSKAKLRMFFLISSCPLTLQALERQAVFSKRKFLLPLPVWLCLVDSARAVHSHFCPLFLPGMRLTQNPKSWAWWSRDAGDRMGRDSGISHDKNRSTHFYSQCPTGNVAGGRCPGWPQIGDTASCLEHCGKSMSVAIASACSVFR